MNEIPTTFVILGVTGDLADKKLLPSIYNLFKKGKLPNKFSIVGFSRRDWSDKDFRNFASQSIGDDNQEFLNNLYYVQGNFDNNESFLKLGQKIGEIDNKMVTCSNKLFHLAVPPKFYETILNQLAKSGLTIPCGGEEGWTRILIEKPFGNDTETARKLDELLGKLFKEEQIFRIDHYLAKEVIQNILAFRFSNTMFEPLWNNKHIEKVSIEMFEDKDVGERGSFYEATGALRDVGQNHLMQMLALVGMEKPESISCEHVRKERAKVISQLRKYTKTDAKRNAVRGQYEGYKETDGVNQESEVETFFSIKAHINNRRWKNVPFILSSGKGLEEPCVQIKIYFKDPDPNCFMEGNCQDQEKNILTFRIQPNEGISILFWVREPGFENKVIQKELSFEYHEKGSVNNHTNAYEKVLFDCISGDQTLFTSTQEVLSSWKFISSVFDSWGNVPLIHYKKGTSPKNLFKK